MRAKKDPRFGVTFPSKKRIRLIKRQLHGVPFGPCRWPSYPCFCYVGQGVIAQMSPDSLDMGAREQERLSPFRDLGDS